MKKQKPYLKLLEESFPGIVANITRWEAMGFSWESSKLFLKEENGEVLSHVALMQLPILVEGQWHQIGALHCVCTVNSQRGRGFAKELMREAVQWANGRLNALILFTEIPAFYEKLFFSRIPEYRFHLSYPHPKGSQPLRPLTAPQDNDLLLRCFREREPISSHLSIKDDGAIASFNTLFATYPNYWSLYYSSKIDGLISFQVRDRTLHLFDIVASTMPSLAVILDHLPAAIEDIYFYFSPDRFTPKAIPEPYLYDNNHLMVHGSWPISTPFMIPPLCRC